MVTDRVIVVSNGSESITLTTHPYTVQNIKGFDTLNVNNVTSQGYGQEGSTLLNTYISSRELEISGQIFAETTASMQRLRDKLLSLFIAHKEITINHYFGGKNRQIKVQAKKTPEFTFSEVTSVQNYSVQLLAVKDPYWSDPVDSLVTIATVKGGFHFPLSIPKDEGVTFGVKEAFLIADVYNSSSMTIGMTFTFIARGTVVNPQLFNINTREFIKLLCTMEAGETIEITTGEECTVTRISKGVEEDYIGKIDLAGGGYTFLTLAPGDNLFRYMADSGEEVLETRITYKNRYAGV